MNVLLPPEWTEDQKKKFLSKWNSQPGHSAMIAVHTRDERQDLVTMWAEASFGIEQTRSIAQRGLRLAEEAIEAAQAAGCDPQKLHQLIDYVYGRPKGHLAQELGGVGVCLLIMAAASGFSADQCECIEVERIQKTPIAVFAKRNQDKNDAGFLA